MSESAQDPSSTKPYLLRALYEWCCDNGFTPYLAVRVDAGVRVPREHVRNGEIVLNIGFSATNGLDMGNEDIRFKARFGGVARDIVVPVSHVTAIYARENGQGMAFPVPQSAAEGEAQQAAQPASPVPESPTEPPAAPPAEIAAGPAAGPRLHAVPPSSPESGAPAPRDDDEPEPPPRTPGPHLKRVK